LVLGGSVPIAVVVNPPSSAKYGFWTNAARTPEPAQWLDGARQHDGSWWPDWDGWLSRKSGRKVAARDPTRGGLPALDDAPGASVKVRAPG
jgi:polyhydroxyalkanoate synthase subunit PhaC